MMKYLSILMTLLIFSSLFQTRAFAYTEETSSLSTEELDAPFLPELPLADLVKPIKVLNGPTVIDQVTVEPNQDEILTSEDDKAFLRTDIPPPAQL